MKHGIPYCPAHTIFRSLLLSATLPALIFCTTNYTYAQSQIELSVEPDQQGQVQATLQFKSDSNTYHFIQGSDSLEQSQSSSSPSSSPYSQWDYLPHATYGDGSTEQIQVSTQGSSYFYRIESTDDPTQAPASLDFDNDGITNADEIRAGGTYHFMEAGSMADTDHDGLPDYWEQFYFGDLSQSATDDFDADGIKNAYEWQIRTSPTIDQTNPETSDTVFIRHYNYSPLGYLTSVTGHSPSNYLYDLEGNLKSSN